MKVKELIEILQKQDQDREVIMAGDSEFEICSPFKTVQKMGYVKERYFSGSCYYEYLTDQQVADGVSEELAIQSQDDFVRCLLLLPEN